MEMKKEIMNNICEWKKSVFFPNNYDVSDSGLVRNKKTNKILKPATDKYGYLYYVLCVNGERRTVKAHRLVALTFISNTENKPTVNHKNGVRTDNRVQNLEWATHKEQANDPLTYQHKCQVALKRDYRAMGMIRDFGRIKVDVYKGEKHIGRYNSLKAAAETLGISYSKASECLNKRRKNAGGYIFIRVPDSGNENEI
jgi:hypothetical protein